METGKSTPLPLDPIRAAMVREQLNRVLSDPAFSGANRRSRLLRYLVEEALEDRGESLKESVIAVEVFDRASDYDPQVDSVVRVEIGRLRTRLSEYYDKAGPDSPVRIEIPKGSYRAIFAFRESPPEIPEIAREVADLPIAKRRRSIRFAAGVGAIAAILSGWAIWRMHVPEPSTPPAIAVLPFLNLSGDAADEYLGDGISDELTEALAEFSDLSVVARTSAFQYKGKGADVREIGRSLRVGAVLEGSVARRDGQFHVIAQLIRTSDGYHLWSHIYDAAPAELPSIESGIARAARERLVLASSTGPAKEAGTARNPEAHDLYIRAVYEFNRRTEASTRQAIRLASLAAEKDHSFAQPYVLMAAGESQLNTFLAQAPVEGVKRAWEDVARALAIDPGNSAGHAQKALLAYTDRWDWPLAESEFRLALAAGSHGSAENLYGWCLMTRGRFAEARRRLQAAAELDPLSLGPQLNQIEDLMAERNYPDAKRAVKQVLSTAPANSVALTLALQIAFWQKDCPAATTSSRRLLEIHPNTAVARLIGLVTDGTCGHADQARTSLTVLAHEASATFLSPYSMAGAFALENDSKHAMYYLQKAADLREPALMLLKVDRAFEPVRQDPGFIALERRIGLRE